MAKFYYMLSPSGEVFETTSPHYHNDCEQLSKAKGQKMMREQSIKRVSEMLQGVDTVYGIVRHVSASGMQRRIDLYIIKDNRPVYLTGYAGRILGWKVHDKGGLVVNGCGMDMVFHAASSIVQSLGIDYKSMRYESI